MLKIQHIILIIAMYFRNNLHITHFKDRGYFRIPLYGYPDGKCRELTFLCIYNQFTTMNFGDNIIAQ